MSYLLNCWYMAAWADELDATAGRGIVSRTVCELPLVLFRDGARVAALLDTCPHRFAPLSRGQLVEGSIQCGYHGLAFGRDGRCTHNPHGPITSSIRVRAFPVIEKYHAIWVWLGVPENADSALLPRLAFLDVEAQALATGYVHGAADYLLYVDNLMDLSHVNYLHSSTVGSDWIVKSTRETTEDEDSVTISWTSRGQSPAPFEVRLGLFGADARLDRRTEVQWFAPATLRLTQAATTEGSAPVTRNTAHVITPESGKTSHYFYVATRDPSLGDFDARLALERSRIITTEDNPMLEAIQARMGTADLFSLGPVSFRIDEGSVLARRRLAARIEREQPSMPSRTTDQK